MTQKEYVTRVLRPAEGYLLTEAADVALAARTFAAEVFLGAGDAAENWREVSIEEAENLQARRQAQLQTNLRERLLAAGVTNDNLKGGEDD
ncbi:MAG: hypothetical protein K2I18_08595 [Paramuribaculum sp.]|nr:hypothetical protein [Paramuribaculum sp.]